MDKREKEHAAGCSTTLITEMHASLHDRARLKKALSKFGVDTNNGYDLLSVPSLAQAYAEEARIDFLSGNVALAVDVHKTELVVVMTGFGLRKGMLLAKKLRTELVQKFPNLTLAFCSAPPARGRKTDSELMPKRLIVTCMDYRLHRDGSLNGMFSPLASWLTYPGAAFAANDKRTKKIFYSDLASAVAREKVTEIMLVSHTDCAKYHAARQFRSETEEARALQADLRTASSKLKKRFSKVKVQTMIAIVKNGVALDLVPVT